MYEHIFEKYVNIKFWCKYKHGGMKATYSWSSPGVVVPEVLAPSISLDKKFEWYISINLCLKSIIGKSNINIVNMSMHVR